MTETPTGPGVYCILLVLEEPLGFSCFELTGTHTHTIFLKQFLILCVIGLAT